jgi:hypothetical protein
VSIHPGSRRPLRPGPAGVDGDGGAPLRAMVAGLSAILWEQDPETRRIRFINARAEELLGASTFERFRLLDVSDGASDRPLELAIGRDAADGGLGLYLVAELCGPHGWTAVGGRKHVRARLDHTRTDPPGWVPRPRGGERDQPETRVHPATSALRRRRGGSLPSATVPCAVRAAQTRDRGSRSADPAADGSAAGGLPCHGEALLDLFGSCLLLGVQPAVEEGDLRGGGVLGERVEALGGED